MKVVERFFPCYILDGSDCVQPEERWGKCGLSEDTGKSIGCSHATAWLREQFSRLKLREVVTIFIDPKDPTVIVGESQDQEFSIEQGVNSD